MLFRKRLVTSFYYSFISIQSIGFLLICYTFLFRVYTLPHLPPMDNISEENYERVLRYMQDEHIENYQQAYKILSQHNFDIDLARLSTRNQSNERRHEQGQQFQQNQEQEEIEQLSRMRSYLLQKSNHRANRNGRKNIVIRLKNCLSITCLNLTQRILPEVIKRSIIRSEFYNLYQDEAVIQLNSRKLQQAVDVARSTKKKIFTIVTGKSKSKMITDLLRKKKVMLKLLQDFQIVGLVHNEFCNEAKALGLPHTITSLDPPFILVFREKHTQNLQLVSSLISEEEISSFNEQTVKNLDEKIKGCINKEALLLRRISERLFGDQMNSGINFGDGFQDDTHERANRYIANRRQSKLIAQQNQQYLQMQKKNKQILQESRKKELQLQTLIQQRQCRKLSIPDEPDQNDNGNSIKIVKIVFRCPNGETISRKFHENEKCEILYNWVQLNDDIQFEGDQIHQIEETNQRKNSSGRVVIGERKFDLFHSYPPESLKDKISMQIREVFEGEDQIKILIREL